jgi:hypothetical protein
MPQYDFGNIVPTTKSGSALAADLNNWRDAVHSGHRGATRPTYVQAGMTWVQEVSGTTWRLYLYDGAQDILMGTFNPTLDTFTVSLGANSVPASAIAGGSGSGLNADQVDGLHATSFVRTDASSQVSFGYSVRFQHPNGTSTEDGKIGARLAEKGLNIYGIATESGDGQRYISMLGNVSILGTLSFTGGLAAYSEISGYARIKAYDGTVQAVIGVKGGYPALTSYNTLAASGAGYGWSAHTAVNSNLQFIANTSENAAGGSVVAWLAPDGEFGGAPYGNGSLSAYFARRPTELLNGPWRDTGARYNCGVYNCNVQTTDGYEVYDIGDGRHKVRPYGGIRASYDCAPPYTPPDQQCSCVVRGTLVRTATGALYPIELIKKGDPLWGGGIVVGIRTAVLGDRPLWQINGHVQITGDHLVKMTGGVWACIEPERIAIRAHHGIAPTMEYTRMRVGEWMMVDGGLEEIQEIVQVDAAPETILFTLIVGGASEYCASNIWIEALTPLAPGVAEFIAGGAV